jgi:hypothetical protein
MPSTPFEIFLHPWSRLAHRRRKGTSRKEHRLLEVLLPRGTTF